MFVRGRARLVRLGAVLMSSGGVDLRLFVFAGLMEVGGLIVVVGGGLMMGRRFVMMLARRMLGFHGAVSFYPLGVNQIQLAFRIGEGS